MVFMAEDADRTGVKAEQPSTVGADAKPGACEGSQQVAMGKQRHSTRVLNRHGVVNHRAASLLHSRGILTPRAAVAPDRPIRNRLLDLRRGETLIVTVVPFPQLLKQHSLLAKSCKLAGASCPVQR